MRRLGSAMPKGIFINIWLKTSSFNKYLYLMFVYVMYIAIVRSEK